MANRMFLQETFFMQMYDRSKTHEIRLHDSKRQDWNNGDILQVKNSDNPTSPVFYIRILNKTLFDNFYDALTYPGVLSGALPTTANVADGISIYEDIGHENEPTYRERLEADPTMKVACFHIERISDAEYQRIMSPLANHMSGSRAVFQTN
jgi:ASC-1-like (ASCH) protein